MANAFLATAYNTVCIDFASPSLDLKFTVSGLYGTGPRLPSLYGFLAFPIRSQLFLFISIILSCDIRHAGSWSLVKECIGRSQDISSVTG
jgi:hypothetical protein